MDLELNISSKELCLTLDKLIALRNDISPSAPDQLLVFLYTSQSGPHIHNMMCFNLKTTSGIKSVFRFFLIG